MTKRKKWIIGISFAFLAVAFFIAFFSLPNWATKIINQQAPEILGRPASIQSLSINYFSASATTYGSWVSDTDNNDTLLYADEVTVNLSLWDVLKGRIAIDGLYIEGSVAKLVYEGESFNYQSLLDHVLQDTTQDSIVTNTKVVIDEIFLENGRLEYTDRNLGIDLKSYDVFVEMTEGFATGVSELSAKTGLTMRSGGRIETDATYHLTSGDFNGNSRADSLNLQALEPYVKDVLHIGQFRSFLNHNVHVSGNIHNVKSLQLKGEAQLRSTSVTDTKGDTLASMRFMHVQLDSASLGEDYYRLQEVRVDGPYAHYSLYPGTDNFRTLPKKLEPKVVTTETGSLDTVDHRSNVFIIIRDEVKKFVNSIELNNFSLAKLNVTGARAHFEDHSYTNSFHYTMQHAGIEATDISSTRDSIPATFKALLNKQGRFIGKGVFHPDRPADMHLELSLDSFNMQDISPYFKHYLGFAIDEGTLFMHNSVFVENNIIKSHNDVDLFGFKLGVKTEGPPKVDVPLKLALNTLQDRFGNVHLNIPIRGDLNNPNYKLGKQILNTLKDLIVRAATAPSRVVEKVYQKTIGRIKKGIREKKAESDK